MSRVRVGAVLYPTTGLQIDGRKAVVLATPTRILRAYVVHSVRGGGIRYSTEGEAQIRFDQRAEVEDRKDVCPGKRWGDSALRAEGKAFQAGSESACLALDQDGKAGRRSCQVESSPPYPKETLL